MRKIKKHVEKEIEKEERCDDSKTFWLLCRAKLARYITIRPNFLVIKGAKSRKKSSATKAGWMPLNESGSFDLL